MSRLLSGSKCRWQLPGLISMACSLCTAKPLDMQAHQSVDDTMHTSCMSLGCKQLREHAASAHDELVALTVVTSYLGRVSFGISM